MYFELQSITVLFYYIDIILLQSTIYMHQPFNKHCCRFIAIDSLVYLAIAQPRTDTQEILPGTGLLFREPAPPVPNPIKEVITAKAITDHGIFDVHKVEDKYYFEIGIQCLEGKY